MFQTSWAAFTNSKMKELGLLFRRILAVSQSRRKDAKVLCLKTNFFIKIS